MVGRRNALLVTKRSLRNSDISAGKRPRRAVQNKLLDDTVGLSRREEQELNKALYASLHETRRTKSVPSLCGHSSSSGNTGNGTSPSTRASHSSSTSNITRASNLKSLGQRRSLCTSSISPKRLVKKNPSVSKLKKSGSFTHSSSTHSHTLARSIPAASISIDESSQDSVRSSCSSVNGSKRKIHAQRKFAQGCSLPGTPSCTPIKSSTPPVKMISSRIPKTEDFLTFLCLRGSSILPPHLDIFNYSREEMPSQEEGPRSAASSAKIKCRRESTPDSSSTSSGANEEVAEAAAVSTPSSTGRSSGSSLLAKRSAARASAGTPETARGIVSLRQGLQRKVSTSSSSSSSARFPVSSSPSRLVSGLTNTPQSWYRTKFYFTPEKSPSPSKASGIRPGEFTPPSLFSSARPESSYFGSTHNFSPLVCPPSSSKFTSNASPSGSLVSRASSSSSSSSLSSSYAGGASKRKRRRSLPSSDATSQVKLVCASASIPSFGVNKCSRLASQDCLTTSVSSLLLHSPRSLSKTLSSSLPNLLSVSTVSPTPKVSCLQTTLWPSSPPPNKSLPVSYSHSHSSSNDISRNSVSQPHTNSADTTKDVVEPCLDSHKFIKNSSAKSIMGKSRGTASNANIVFSHNSPPLSGVAKDSVPINCLLKNSLCKSCHVLECLRSGAASSDCNCLQHEDSKVQIDERGGSVHNNFSCRRNVSSHHSVKSCECSYSKKAHTFLHDCPIRCLESQCDCCNTNQFMHDSPSSSRQCLHECSFSTQPYLHDSCLPNFNHLCMRNTLHLPTNSAPVNYSCSNSRVYGHLNGKNCFSCRATHSDSCVPYTAHGHESDIDNTGDHSSLCACDLCSFSGGDNTSQVDDEVFLISDDSNNSCDIKSILFEGSDGEVYEGYTAESYNENDNEELDDAQTSTAQDAKNLMCDFKDNEDFYVENNVNDNMSFSVVTETEELCQSNKEEQRSDTESMKRFKRSERKRRKHDHANGKKKSRRRERVNDKRSRDGKKYHLVKEVPKLKIRIVRKRSPHSTVESTQNTFRAHKIKKPSHGDFQMEYLKMLQADGIVCSPSKTLPMSSQSQHVEEKKCESSSVLSLSDGCKSKNEEGLATSTSTENVHGPHPEPVRIPTETDIHNEDFSECDESINGDGETDRPLCTDLLEDKEIKMLHLPTPEKHRYSDPSNLSSCHSQYTTHKDDKSVSGSSQLADSLILRDKVISAFAKFNRKETIVSSIEVIRGSEQDKNNEEEKCKEIEDKLKNNSEDTGASLKTETDGHVFDSDWKEKNLGTDENHTSSFNLQGIEVLGESKKKMCERSLEQALTSQGGSSHKSFTSSMLSKHVQTENLDGDKDLQDQKKTNFETSLANCESSREVGSQTLLFAQIVTGQERQAQADLCTNPNQTSRPNHPIHLSENGGNESKSTSNSHVEVGKLDLDKTIGAESKNLISAISSVNCSKKSKSGEIHDDFLFSIETNICKNTDKGMSCFGSPSSNFKENRGVGSVSSYCQTEDCIEIIDDDEDPIKPSLIIVVDDSSDENDLPNSPCHEMKRISHICSSGERKHCASQSSCAVNKTRNCCDDTSPAALDLAKNDLHCMVSRKNKVVQTEVGLDVNEHITDLLKTNKYATSQKYHVRCETTQSLQRDQSHTEHSKTHAEAKGSGGTLVNTKVASENKGYNRQSFSYVCSNKVSHPEVSSVTSHVSNSVRSEKTTANLDPHVEFHKSHSTTGAEKANVDDKEIIILDDNDEVMNFYQGYDRDRQDVISAEIHNFRDFVIDLSVTGRSNSASSSSSDSFSASSSDCSFSSSNSSFDQVEVYQSYSHDSLSSVNARSITSSRCDHNDGFEIEKESNFDIVQSSSKVGKDMRLESEKSSMRNGNQISEIGILESRSNTGPSQIFIRNKQSNSSSNNRSYTSNSPENPLDTDRTTADLRLNVSTGSLFQRAKLNQCSSKRQVHSSNSVTASQRSQNRKFGVRKQQKLKDTTEELRIQCKDPVRMKRTHDSSNKNVLSNRALTVNEPVGLKGKKCRNFPSFPRSQRERSFSDGDNQRSSAIMLHSYGSLNTGEGFALVNGQLQQCEILDKNQMMAGDKSNGVSLPSRNLSTQLATKSPSALKSQSFNYENKTSCTNGPKNVDIFNKKSRVNDNSSLSLTKTISHNNGNPALDFQKSQSQHNCSPSNFLSHQTQDRLCLQESIYLRHDNSSNSGSDSIPSHTQKYLQNPAECSSLSRRFEEFRISSNKNPLFFQKQHHHDSRNDFSQFVIKPKSNLEMKQDVPTSKTSLVIGKCQSQSLNGSSTYPPNDQSSLDQFVQQPKKTTTFSKGRKTSKTKSTVVSTLERKNPIPPDSTSVITSITNSDKSLPRDTYASVNNTSFSNLPSNIHLNSPSHLRFDSGKRATHFNHYLQVNSSNDKGTGIDRAEARILSEGTSKCIGNDSISWENNPRCSMFDSSDALLEMNKNYEQQASQGASVGACSSQFQKSLTDSRQTRKINEKPKSDVQIISDAVDLSYNASQSPPSTTSTSPQFTLSTSIIDGSSVLPVHLSKPSTSEGFISSNYSSSSVFPVSLHCSCAPAEITPSVAGKETDRRTLKSGQLESEHSPDLITGPFEIGNQDENVLDVIMQELKVQIALLKSEISKENRFQSVENFTCTKNTELCLEGALSNSTLGPIRKSSPPSYSSEDNVKEVGDISVKVDEEKEIKPKSEVGSDNSMLKGGSGELFEVIWTCGNPHFSPNQNPTKGTHSRLSQPKQVPQADDIEFLHTSSLECIEICSDNESY